ncbi:Rossmann-fold NAD(P)-binding domain-containing protein [Streptomyces sp. OR43]|uniref:hypothetical protein n=1 Tax=Streptomyces sp. or43 TaxID=2478957 RepID=UPI001651370A|nr:hypothetical protein [Streptomyces sp. or43]
MELSGARVLMAGATGVLGGAITAEVAGRGARVALSGRDPSRSGRAAPAYRGAPTARFGVYDPASCARAVRETSAVRPGHLDADFAQRPVAGTAPPLPRGGGPRHVAAAAADALAADAEPVRTGPDRTPVVERRAP